MRKLIFFLIAFSCAACVFSDEVTTTDERTIRYDPTEQSYYTRLNDLAVGRYYLDGYQSRYRAAATYDFSDYPDWYIAKEGYLAITASAPGNTFRLFITDVDKKHPPSRSDAQLYGDIDSDVLTPNGLQVQMATSYSGTITLNQDMLDHFDSSIENGYSWAALGFKTGEASSEDNSKSDITQILNLTVGPVMSTSGELSDDERWGGTHTLSGNIEVPSGVELKLWSGLSLNLNGYYIKSTGGTITEEGSFSINTEIVAKLGSTIKGYYPSISSALSNSDQGQTVHVYSSQTLGSDLAVAYKTLSLDDGILTLGDFKVTARYGTIAMNGGSVSPNIQRKTSAGVRKGLYPTIADAIADAATNDEVYLGSGSFTEDVDMPSNFELHGNGRSATTINGDVTFDRVSSSEISNLTVNGEIVADGGSSVYIHYLYAKDVIDIDLGSSHDIWMVTTQNSGYIELYCTSPLVDDIDSYNSESCGITAYGSDYSSSDAYFEGKTSWAVYCTSSCDPDLDNTEFCGNDLDIYATSGCTVDTSDATYFSECPAPTGGSSTVT